MMEDAKVQDQAQPIHKKFSPFFVVVVVLLVVVTVAVAYVGSMINNQQADSLLRANNQTPVASTKSDEELNFEDTSSEETIDMVLKEVDKAIESGSVLDDVEDPAES